jgi:hypothetical protein
MPAGEAEDLVVAFRGEAAAGEQAASVVGSEVAQGDDPQQLVPPRVLPPAWRGRVPAGEHHAGAVGQTGQEVLT